MTLIHELAGGRTAFLLVFNVTMRGRADFLEASKKKKEFY
jgi:hypothetical protein